MPIVVVLVAAFQIFFSNSRIGYCFENAPYVNSDEESQTFWSRIKHLDPSRNTNMNTNFSPKYVFKGLKERISSDLEDGFVNSESPLNSAMESESFIYKNDSVKSGVSGTLSYHLKHKISDKSFWNNSQDLLSAITTITTEASSAETVTTIAVPTAGNEINETTAKNGSELRDGGMIESTRALILSKESERGTNFPIYFTNPATGIVYVIQPVGSSQNHNPYTSHVNPHPYTIENYTSQMYVTKEDYERKIELLKEQFRQQCSELKKKLESQNHRILSTSTTTSTTKRPNKRNKKKIIKHSDPLIVEAVGGVLSDVYDTVVDTVTKKVVKKNKKKKRKGSGKKRKAFKKKKNFRLPSSTTTTIPSFNEYPTGQSQGDHLDSDINIWHGPVKPSQTTQNYYYDEYENGQRFKLISYNGENKKNSFIKPSKAPLVQEGEISRDKYLIPIPLTPTPVPSTAKRKKVKKRSISHITTQNSLTTSLDVTETILVQNETKSELSNESFTFNQNQKTNAHDEEMSEDMMKNPLKIRSQTHHHSLPIPTPFPNPRIREMSNKDDGDDYYLDFDDLIYGSDYDYSNENWKDPSQFFDNQNENTDKKSKTYALLRENLKRRRKNRGNFDGDYSYFDDPGIFGYITDFVSSIHNTVNSFLPDSTEYSLVNEDMETAETSNDVKKSKIPKPLNPSESEKAEEYNDKTESNYSVGSWFTSWFGSDENDSNESQVETADDTVGWFDSWFGTEEKASEISSENEDDSGGQWLFGWFDSEPKQKTTSKLKTATTTTTSAPIPTTADSMVNPEKWIGILAQHIINSSSSTTSSTSGPVFDYDAPSKVNYAKYQIWRLKLHKEGNVQALQEYKKGSEGFKMQWLLGPSLRGLTDVAVPPKLISNFQKFLKSEGIGHEVLLYDFGKTILYEESKEKLIPKPKRPHPLTWQKYHSYDEIVRFAEYYQMKNQNLVELLHIGRSYEGRPLIIIKISLEMDSVQNSTKTKLKYKKANKSGVFIEAGAHGREWIGPASATWIINELIKIIKSNQTTADTDFIKKTTWYIIPVLNPDGYTYSQEYDRLWRKSRSKNLVRSNGILGSAIKWFQKSEPSKYCYGVDLDRNWDYEWSRKGTSKSACNEFFGGHSAFSEPETKALSKFLLDHKKEIKLFISMHSYGQIISFPDKIKNSYTSQKLDDLLDVAMVGIDGLRKSGSKARYKIDSTNDMTSIRSGTSDAYALNVAGIPFSFTFHLGDNGIHGFLLPGSFIESTSRDAFEIIKAMVDYIQ